MTGYTQKTLMQNERIIYAAHGHFFNYFASVVVIILGFFLSGILQPQIPDQLRQYEVVNEAAQNLDKKVSGITQRVDQVQDLAKRAYSSITHGMPQEVQEAPGFLAQMRQTYFGLVFLFLGFVNFLRQYIVRQTNEYSVTNKRVIFKFGFLTTDTQEINLDRIEGVKVQQDMTDKLVGRGTVIINGIGHEQVVMARISDPVKLRKAILESMGKVTQRQ